MVILYQVKAGYSGRAVIQIDEARFEDGNISVLIGRNGSGKSTLLRAVAGILPYSGEILIDDGRKRGVREDLLSVREFEGKARARRIGLLPQSQIPAEMEVFTLIMHGRYSRLSWPGRPGEQDRKAVEEAVSLTGTKDYLGRSVSHLSGGERQLCYLAMVIAQDPDIFLLDEPMSAMDISHQLKIMQILRRLRDRGKTVIMTSHDLPQSFTLADRIVLLRAGRMTGEGTPEELTERPALVREAMGASVKRAEEEGLLYPYLLCP